MYFAASSAASAGLPNFSALDHLFPLLALPCSTCGGTSPHRRQEGLRLSGRTLEAKP